jgi:hypothetical protein
MAQASLGDLSALVEAHLSFNQLRSPLPAGLGGLKRLKVLPTRDKRRSALATPRASRLQPRAPRLQPRAPRLQPRACTQVLDIRDNEGVTELPPELMRDTPLQSLMVGAALVGGDGQLVAMEGRDSSARRPP